MIRIANGQGFWGDWLEAPVRLVEQGPIDYLVLDYLAEVTMSILQKQKQDDPDLGYARDFPPLIGRIAAPIRERGMQVIANAGGVNPRRLRARSGAAGARRSKSRWCWATTCSRASTNSSPRATRCATWTPASRISAIRGRILSANAYIGAFPLAEALDTGADVVIAGRSTDTALTLAPMIHRFGWKPGRLRQARRGHHRRPHHRMRRAVLPAATARWTGSSIPDMANIGYPIVEAEPDGTLRRHQARRHRRPRQQPHRQGATALRTGRSAAATSRPIAWPISPPSNWQDDGPDRVRVTGIRGGPRPPTLKLSISYSERLEGHRHAGLFAGRRRSKRRARPIASCASASTPRPALRRNLHRILRRQRLPRPGRAAQSRSARSAAPHRRARAGPQSRGPLHARTDSAGAQRSARRHRLRRRPAAVREIVAYWSALIPREEIATRVEVVE